MLVLLTLAQHEVRPHAAEQGLMSSWLGNLEDKLCSDAEPGLEFPLVLTRFVWAVDRHRCSAEPGCYIHFQAAAAAGLRLLGL